MIYLLDANVLIDAERDYYTMERVPEFWDWLLHLADSGQAKLPIEVLEELSRGQREDPLVMWVKRHKAALIWTGEAVIGNVRRAVNEGYAADLTEDELQKLGADPFLLAHALSMDGSITLVTMEVSKPRRERANRHLPDVCKTLGVPCIDTFELLRRLNFRTDWRNTLRLGRRP